jgi:hypothetical protein
MLSDTVTPLWRVDYAKQLRKKQEWSYAVLKKIKDQKVPNLRVAVNEIIPSVCSILYIN